MRLAQDRFRNLRVIVIAPAGDGPIRNEMLEASGHAIARRRVAPLKPFHLRHRAERIEIRVLAASLRHAPPTRIARQIAHRSEHPVHARLASLAGRDGLRPFQQFRFPCAREPKRDGKQNPVPVNHIIAKTQRNPQPGLLNRNLLQPIMEHRPVLLGNKRPHLAGSHPRRPLLRRLIELKRLLGQLPQLLLHRHARQQIFHPRFHGQRRVPIRRRRPRLRGKRVQRERRRASMGSGERRVSSIARRSGHDGRSLQKNSAFVLRIGRS